VDVAGEEEVEALRGAGDGVSDGGESSELNVEEIEEGEVLVAFEGFGGDGLNQWRERERTRRRWVSEREEKRIDGTRFDETKELTSTEESRHETSSNPPTESRCWSSLRDLSCSLETTVPGSNSMETLSRQKSWFDLSLSYNAFNPRTETSLHSSLVVTTWRVLKIPDVQFGANC